MPIRAYGLFWEKDSVEWSPGRGNKGAFRLLGRRATSRPHLKVADFRAQQGLYVLHNNHGIYYVGLVRSGSLGKRLKDHLDDDHRSGWNRFSWFGFRQVLESKDEYGFNRLKQLATLNADESMSAIKDMEALLINVINPPGNANWMNFSNADPWEQVATGDEEAEYRRKLAR